MEKYKRQLPVAAPKEPLVRIWRTVAQADSRHKLISVSMDLPPPGTMRTTTCLEHRKAQLEAAGLVSCLKSTLPGYSTIPQWTTLCATLVAMVRE